MKNKKVAIIGGGLSGVYAAYLLELVGVYDYLLFEAKEILGGRITTVGSNDDLTNRFDLGPTWYWPQVQPEFSELISQLRLATFQQYDDGDMLFEREIDIPPSRVPGYVQSPTSYRLVGGMSSLIDALSANLSKDNIITSCQAKRLRITGDMIEVLTINSEQKEITYSVSDVLLAVPPRLAEKTIEFEPVLPKNTKLKWRSIETWMARQAKYLAVYDEPFWRTKGFSGQAASLQGTMSEIHDASISDDSAALFGFLRVPPIFRKNVPEEKLKSYCREQIVNLFGHKGANPRVEFIKDWAQDSFVATDLDIQDYGFHNITPETTILDSIWESKLTGIASEWASTYPGYLAGAIEAASSGVTKLTSSALEFR